MAGNVIPNKGPTMERIYDDMGKDKSANHSAEASGDLTSLRKSVATEKNTRVATLPAQVNRYAAAQEFHKLPNPELHLYVFPHLAGQDQVPVPGYYTAFNAYEHDHYALPQETARG